MQNNAFSVLSKNAKNNIFSIILFLCVILVVGVSNALYAVDTLWRLKSIAGHVDTSPGVADLDGDGILDLVLCSTKGRVLAVDANGHEKWTFDAKETISNPPTIAGRPLRIYVMTNPGRIICLNAENGAEMWEYKMSSDFLWGMTALAAADITGDGQIELIAADRGSHLVCLNTDGVPLWKTVHKSGFNTAPAVADLNGDGRPEILLGTTDMPLVCFSNKGKELWHVKGGDPVASSPIVYDLNNDETPEILLGEGDGLSVYDVGGVRKWHHPMKGQVHDAIAIGDVDQDGQVDIVVVDLLGEVACLTGGGELKWTAGVKQRARRSPAIADIDGDMKPEVIVGNYSDALYVFDGQGNLKEQVPLNGGMNASPTVVDFRGDGRLSVICATTSDVVALSWLPTKPRFSPEVQWAEYRMNSRRSASQLAVTKIKRARLAGIDYGPMHVGVNEFRIAVENPKKQRLTLRMEIRKNNTAPTQSVFSSSDSLFSYRMPYSIVGQSAVNVQFACSLNAGKKLLSRQRREFYLVPFAKDVADLHKIMAGIENNISRMTDGSYANEQTTLLKLKLHTLEKKTNIAGTMTPLQRAGLRTQFEKMQQRAMRLKAMTAAAVKTGSALAAYAANPWAPFGGVDEIVEGRTSPPNLVVEAFAGETESAAVNLANFSSRAVVVRVEPQDLLATDSTTVPFRQVLEFHEVLDVPTHSLDLSADALPRINQARTIMLPAWSVRQIWVNVDAAKLNPGDWKTKIRFRTLEVEPQETFTNLSVKVWAARLSKKQPLRLCQWGYVQSSILKDMPDAALKDQVQHGTNVFVATGAFVPQATFDKNGDLIGSMDFTAHDKYVRRHSPFGIILFCGYQGGLKGPAAQLSPTWIKAYKQWIGAWVKHLLALGLTYDDFAFYPVDEPGLHEGQVDKVVSFAKPIKEMNAKIKFYTDPVDRTSMADLKKMAPYIDIWCPNRNGYLLHKGGKKLDFLKSTGSTVWTYECEGDAKHQSPLGYYRAQSWLVWRHGLTGIGFWSYCTSQYDPWYVPRGGQDYLLIYQGDGVVTSKRWEAVRDGIEDYNMLVQLQKIVKQPPQGVSSKALSPARTFLQKEAAAIGDYCGVDDDGTLPGIDGLPGVRRIEDRRWEKIKRARRRMAELLQVLTQ